MRDRRTLVELLRGRFRCGLTHALDWRLALTDRANAEAQIAEQRNRVQTLARALEVLLGSYPGGRFKPAETLPSLPPPGPAGLPSHLIEHCPDLSAAFERLEQHGLIEILTLLDSYRSTMNAQSAHLIARRQLLNNRIALYLALGGGF
jgi:outer membrane protein TolC